MNSKRTRGARADVALRAGAKPEYLRFILDILRRTEQTRATLDSLKRTNPQWFRLDV